MNFTKLGADVTSCPGWWESSQGPWTCIFVEGMWLNKVEKHPRRECCVCSEGEKPLCEDFKLRSMEAAWGLLSHMSSLRNWHPSASHKKGQPQPIGQLGLGICAEESYSHPTLTLCPEASAHGNTSQMDLPHIFRAWGIIQVGLVILLYIFTENLLGFIKEFQNLISLLTTK